MKKLCQALWVLTVLGSVGRVQAAPQVYAPDANTIGLYHLDTAGVWVDASTNRRDLADSPGAVLTDTTDLAAGFVNGYRGGTGSVGAVQSTNANWTFGAALTAESWFKAGVSGSAMAPVLMSLRDKIEGVIVDFVLRDLNIAISNRVFMTPMVRYTDASATWIEDAAASAYEMTTGSWYHVAFVLDLSKGTRGQVAVYVTPRGAPAPVLFQNIDLSATLYKGASTKSWTLCQAAGGAFVFDEIRLSSTARASGEFTSAGARPSWVSLKLQDQKLVADVSNAPAGPKVYRCSSLIAPVWLEVTNAVWAAGTGGLQRVDLGTPAPSPLFFRIGP